MKIDILVWSLRGGGAERVAVNLANGWCERGQEVRLLIQSPVDMVEYRPLPGVELVSCAGGLIKEARVPRRLFRLRRALRRRRADVVVAIQANMAVEAVVASVGLGLRIVGCEHSSPKRAVRGRLWLFLRPFAYRRLAAVTALTAGAAQELQELCPGSEVVVVPNALRLPIAETPPRLDPNDCVPATAPLLLAAGRMIVAKGFDLLILNFAQLARTSPDVRLVILGDGPLLPQLCQQVEALGLSERVLLPGRAGNMAEWYSRASLYLMTSRWEGLPMVMLEAMAHGLPVVATDFRYGPKEVIRDGIDGRIIPEGDSKAWVEAVSELLGNKWLRQSMAARAREVKERFGEDEVMRLWWGVFDSLGLVKDR